ncbi:MAG: uracil-DNA glycosylase [Lachnospiraceae bacterium]|nr:uracil-DNA glycosylase [Lachnospiraceae bacterium]
MSAIANDWTEKLSPEYKKPYYRTLFDFVSREYETHVIYPPSSDIFNAFHYSSFKDTRVVILGQDPYHEPGQANGLCFSVKPPVDIPPSLQNIYKELHDDVGCYIPDNGDLTKWASQGVLLLNTVLTVRAHAANSHAGHGWEEFTDAALKALNEKDTPVVFLLWGTPAGRKAELITNPKHLILKSPHPSPLSAYRGFFGCRHFSKTNEFLEKNGLTPIDWQIESLKK